MATAKKTGARKAASKKAAKKAPEKTATKKSSAVSKTAKKAPAKKVAAKKAAAKKPAAKAAAKKAPVKKAKKAAAKKAAAKKPAAKAGAKKAPVKKAKKSPFGKKFIDEMKARLLTERAKYLHSAEEYRAEADALIEGREPGDVQFDEESGEGDTVAVERERDLALSAQARAAVEQIDAALDRIADGTYGICVTSGLAIPQDRLRAIPWAAERVEYKVGGLGRLWPSHPMTGRLEEEIPEALAGERLDRTIALLTDLSRSAVTRLIGAGDVVIDGEVASSGSHRVTAGQTIGVALPEPVDPRPVADPDVEFTIRHEDPHLAVIDKPAGLVVHPGAGRDASTLVHGLVHRFPELAQVGETHRPGIVHRLDRGTSGLIVVARTAEAHAALVAQMAAHEPERLYVALVWGHPATDEGTIDAPIGRSARHPTRMTVTDRGRPAVTHYVVRRRFQQPRPVALLECRLETGRTHQIRVHLHAIGHPVVGDRDYDGGRPGLDPGRPFLHAASLTFRHPVTGETVSVASPLPADLEATLAECR